MIDAARRGKARAEDGPALAPRVTPMPASMCQQHDERIADTKGRKGRGNDPTRHSLGQDGAWQAISSAEP
ncbi:MAG: hypothetical protein AB7P24_16955 [Nitrospira sp.]